MRPAIPNSEYCEPYALTVRAPPPQTCRYGMPISKIVDSAAPAYR